ncbi:uncharacterized protein LOC133522918 isoform X2 [Cydia pomonella]|nr:uncharacterized protein LOC133522918 isoform X2 [Cydia pomonella]
MDSHSRSRSRSPVRWDNTRLERRERSSSSRRRSRERTPRRWAPWRPRESVDREPPAALDEPESQSRQDGRVSITAIEVSRAANRWRNGCVDGATSLPSTRHTTPFLSWPQEGTRSSQLWRQHSYQTDQSATFVPITPLEPRNVISRGNCNQIIGGEFVIQPFENLDRRGHYAWNFGSENNCKLVVG